MEDTTCYAFFLIRSAGKLDYYNGFIPSENSAFNPDEITNAIGIKPFKTIKYGTLRDNGKGTYNFSSWYGCKQVEPDVSRLQQCNKIVEELKSHVPVLMQFKEKYNLSFSIQIFPCAENKKCGDVIGFTREIIDFCYMTGTEIVVDMFLYSKP